MPITMKFADTNRKEHAAVIGQHLAVSWSSDELEAAGKRVERELLLVPARVEDCDEAAKLLVPHVLRDQACLDILHESVTTYLRYLATTGRGDTGTGTVSPR